MVSVHIDEEKKHVLCKISKTKQGTRIKESDHNTIISQFNCKVIVNNKKEKIEVYNLKDKECQSKFKAFTSETKMFSTIFESSDDTNILTERLVKKINGAIATNFSKRRISFKSEETKDDKLYDIKRELKGKTDADSKAKMKEVTDSLAEVAEQNFKKLKEELSKMKATGVVDAKQMWKLRKKMCPKSRDPPTSILDKHGNLLTSDEAINNRAIEVFTERLENNSIKPHLKDLETDTNDLCEINLKLAKSNKTEPWTMSDLDDALKHLDNEKSRDSDGFANELFKVAGGDLRLAVLNLMNMMKERQTYPKNLERVNVTAIHKKKSKRDLCNYRGVFRVQILRSILDRLTYNDLYYTIDNHLSDGNTGARKHRSVRDNVFVISAITNSVLNGDSPAQTIECRHLL